MSFILITGASGGIGRAIASQCAAEGKDLFLIANSHYEELTVFAENLKEKYSSRILTFRADLSSEKDIEGIYLFAESNSIDVEQMVFSAGESLYKLTQDTTPEEWNHLMAVNLNSVFLLTKYFLPQMISRQSGKIITISSIWGVTGASMEVAYSTSKAALIGFTKALAKEVGPSGIQVNAVAPGLIDTEMNHIFSQTEIDDFVEMTALQKIGKPEDVAMAVSFLLNKSGDFITGEVLNLNGGALI